MMHFIKSKWFLLGVLGFYAGVCFGQNKLEEAEGMIWGGRHAMPLKRALRHKHPEKITRIYIEVDSTTVFPSADLMQFKNLEFISLWARDSVGHRFIWNDHFPLKGIRLKIDTVRLKQFTHLKSIAFEGFDFRVFPKELCVLTHLKSLEMGVCNIYALPAEISKMKSLEAIELRVNNLSSLPVEIETMDSLLVIDLGNNDFKEIPPEVLKMKSLEELNMANAEATWEDSDYPNFPIHIDKINYAQDNVFPVLLKKSSFLGIYISIYSKAIYSENNDEKNFTREKCKAKIMPDMALRKKIDFGFDYAD